MIDVYLFDWGDTLMVDYPDMPGKMCDWKVIRTVDGAKEALEHLSRKGKIYIATGAAESTEFDIKKAFDRVDLGQFISGYFCEDNLGVAKGSPEFLEKIISRLGKTADRIAMVGDSLAKDIEPDAAVGIKPIWLSKASSLNIPEKTTIISSLHELCL